MAKKRKNVLIVLAVIVVIIVAAVMLLTSNMRSMQASSNTVVSAAAEKGSIQKTVVGTGSLANDEANEIEVPVGLEVEEVYVEAGDSVKRGEVIAKVTELSVKKNILEIQESIDALEEEIDNLDDDADHYEITRDVKTAEKEDLEETLAEMEILLESCNITSTYDGVIESIDLTANTEIEKNAVSANTGTTDSSTQTTGTSSYNFSNMRSGTANKAQFVTLGSAKGDVFVNASDTKVTADEPQKETGDSKETESETQRQEEGETQVENKPTVLYGNLTLSVAKPVSGAAPQQMLGIDESQSHFSSTISWSPAGEVFMPGTAYTAVIHLTASEGYVFALDSKQLDLTVDSHSGPAVELKDLNNDGNIETIKVTVTYPATEANTQNPDKTGETQGGTGQSGAAGQGSTADQGNVGSQNTGGSSSLGASGAASSTGSASDALNTSGTASYSAYKTVGATVIPKDNMILNISVDELDILSVSLGQQVEIRLDAISGENFTGKITDIAADAVSSGGVSKYDVEITLVKTASMKSGMSASATIIVDEKADTLLIPMDALQETDGRTFVYTSYEGNEAGLAEEIDVETGLSNSDKVEIISGLSEGAAVYYNEVTLEESGDSGMGMMGGMGGGRTQSGSGEGGEE